MATRWFGMMRTAYLTRCAPIAIAAMAALPSTSAMAQDAAPVAAPAVAQTPVIVLPAPAPTTAAQPARPTTVQSTAPATTANIPSATNTSAPIVIANPPSGDPASQTATAQASSPSPAVAVPTNTPRAAAPVAAQAAEPAAAPRARAAAPAQQARARSAAPAVEQNQPAAAPVAEPAMADMAVASEDPLMAPTDNALAAPMAAEAPMPEAAAAAPIEDGSSQALWLALAGALGLGVIGAGIAFDRRRRTRVLTLGGQQQATLVDTLPMLRQQPAAMTPTPQTEPQVAPEPLAYEPGYAPQAEGAVTTHAEIFDTTARMAIATPTSKPAATGSSQGTVVLPQEVPESFEERDALLKQMVAARPDKANPFRSGKARARRARLIMQSIEESFEKRKPRIDLSQYTEIWPALRGWRPATS